MANLTWIVLLAAIFGCVYALPQIGDECKDHFDCRPDFICRNETCQCVAGQTFFEGRCRPRVGAYCETTEDCEVPLTSCQNEKCTCKNGFFDYNSGERCATGVDAMCIVDHNCEAEFTFCNLVVHRCQCKSKFAPTPIFTCAPFTHHHDHCEYDSQCSLAVPNTFCNVTEESQRCDCTPKYFYADGECHLKKYVPDKCVKWDDCFTPNSYCKKGRCACRPNHELEEGECRRASNSSMIA